MAMYIQEMGRMLALPQGAEVTHRWPACPRNAVGHQAMAGEERLQVGLHADGADAGTTAAVGNAEGFVQVQVADIGPKVGGAAQPHLGVHVGPIHINLAAVGVDDVADLANACSNTPWVEG
jgi:hypothetical protein